MAILDNDDSNGVVFLLANCNKKKEQTQMSNEKIIKVIMDGALPRTCGSCYHIVVRPKGRRVFWECYFVEGSIESRDMVRPEWCPLVVEKDTKCEKLKDALEADLHALYAIQDLMMEHPIIRGHATTMTIINASITRASKLLKESEDK